MKGYRIDELNEISRKAQAGYLDDWRTLRAEMLAQARSDGVSPAGIKHLEAMAERYRTEGLAKIRGLDLLARADLGQPVH